MEYELKTKSGKVVRWEGKTPEEAATRYVDAHKGESVIAWRNIGVNVLQVNIDRIVIEQ